MKIIQSIFSFLILIIFYPITVSGQLKINDHTILSDSSALLYQAADPQDRIYRAELYQQVLGVLDELNGYRFQFLLDGSLINIFPTAYYHVTAAEAMNIKNGNYCYPIEKMKQLLEFYMSYKINRNKWDAGNIKEVEPHWLTHFNFAENSGISFFSCKLSCVLASGIDAHVKCDLPRALRSSLPVNTNEQIKLFDEFRNSNLIFETALRETVSDINAINTCGKLMEILDKRSSDHWIHTITDISCYPFDSQKHVYVASDVIKFREAAWRLAVSASEIKDLEGNKLTQQHVFERSGRDNVGQSFFR